MNWRQQTEHRAAERSDAASEDRNGNAEDHGSSSAEGELTPNSKLRDLRPEKDPMGAGKKTRPAEGA